MTHPADAKETVQRYLRAIAERDAPAVIELLAEDAEFWISGEHAVSGSFRGRDAVLGGFLLPMGELFDPEADYTIDVSSLIADGDKVAVECVSRSVTRAGRPYENHIVSVYTVRDQQIAGMREYFDTQHFAEATAPRSDAASE
ncbi:nuclear transport factor 2 family protein [Kitasatospora sp. McL0602]|uniref:nuclear transport factor 2 family protein n=1 Tax=Kitasatospora sp. McL0602 TaxID=3439530 RepID=UPI003F88A413